MRISDWSSDVCSSDLQAELERFQQQKLRIRKELRDVQLGLNQDIESLGMRLKLINMLGMPLLVTGFALGFWLVRVRRRARQVARGRSEEHTSELQSLMRISYAVFCL